MVHMMKIVYNVIDYEERELYCGFRANNFTLWNIPSYSQCWKRHQMRINS